MNNASSSETYEFRRGVDRDAALAIIEQAQDVDGIRPISEQFEIGITTRERKKDHVQVGAYRGNDLLGFIAIDGDSAELVVAPEARDRGIGSAFLRGAQGEFAAQGLARSDVSQFWAHGDLPAAQRCAQQLGLVKTRELLVMAAPVAELSFSEEVPAGYEVKNLAQLREQWGKEAADSAWLQANNEAFDWHPEQGNWSKEQLAQAQEVEWFDPRDVLFLVDESLPDSPRVAGFHWLKRQSDSEGEVYVVGLANDYRGRGLGTPLMEMGLRQLRDHHVDRVLLYVEADNVPAVQLYKRLGFAVAESHVVYSVPATV